MDFFTRKASNDERLAKEASGDMDLVISPLDGALVSVCEQGGVHVCGYCLDQFEQDARSPKRAVEFTPVGLSDDGQNFGTRLLLHAKCVRKAENRGGNLVADRVRGHQARRALTKLLKPFTGGDKKTDGG